MARRPSPRARIAKGTGLPPAFVAIAVILVAAVGVLFVVSQVQPPAQDEAPRAKADPFADMPAEEPPGGRKPAGVTQRDAAAQGDPFADLASVKEEQLWKDALELGDAGMELVSQAGDAKAAGDLAGFKSLGQQAKEKLALALESTLEWEHALAAQHGANHPDVRSIQRTRTIWRKQLAALKKTVGF